MQDIEEDTQTVTHMMPPGGDPTDCMFKLMSVHNGIEQPTEIDKVQEMIRKHPGYRTKITSLTRWVLDNVVTGKLFPPGADEGARAANEAYARSVFEYLFWDGEDKMFSEGEGAEANFVKMFSRE